MKTTYAASAARVVFSVNAALLKPLEALACTVSGLVEADELTMVAPPSTTLKPPAVTVAPPASIFKPDV